VSGGYIVTVRAGEAGMLYGEESFETWSILFPTVEAAYSEMRDYLETLIQQGVVEDSTYINPAWEPPLEGKAFSIFQAFEDEDDENDYTVAYTFEVTKVEPQK
jgi:hypothetical protein